MPGREAAAAISGRRTPAGTLGSRARRTLRHTSTATAEWILQGFAGNPYNIPLGGMLEFTGTTAPNGSFVLPFGQAISRSIYAAYFAMVGTTYGAGDGSTFNVIDKRGRVSAGKDDMGGSAASRLTSTYFGTSASALGAVGGLESHTLTTAQLASHSHTITDPGHSHTTDARKETNTGAVFVTQGGDDLFAAATVNSNTTGITGTNAAGSGSAHNNVQPTIIVNYILRVL